jgi:hypothetical protein
MKLIILNYKYTNMHKGNMKKIERRNYYFLLFHNPKAANEFGV